MLALLLTTVPGCDPPQADLREVVDVEAHIEALCVEYCPLRIACVKDGWAGGSVNECVRQCADERLYERGGEPSAELIGQLECLAALSCEELPATVAGGVLGERPCMVEPVDLDSAGFVEE